MTTESNAFYSSCAAAEIKSKTKNLDYSNVIYMKLK